MYLIKFKYIVYLLTYHINFKENEKEKLVSN